MSGQSQTQTFIEQLASKIAAPIDEMARERAGLHLVNWLGCAVAGRASAAGEAFAAARDESPVGTAFFWGALGNVLEMDDVDKRAILHPGPCIVPAALATAQSQPDVSGVDLLDAIVRGYEATIRLGRAVGPAHYRLWHNTGTCGPIGAAAASASLLNFDPCQTAHALALAMSQAAGVWQTRHETASMGKQLHTANAARAGVEAARLAAAGALGPLSILEGEQGFFAATCPDGTAANVLADYGDDWLIHQVSFKPWPACRHAHAAIDAALSARKTAPAFEDIAHIEVRTYPDALKFCDKPVPKSTAEAKFSLQHSVAIALLCGAPGFADFEPDAINDPQTIAVRERVAVQAADPFASAFPARYGAEIVLTLTDGKTQTAVIPDALGDPENPIGRREIFAKAEALMSYGGLADTQAAELISSAETAFQAASVVPILRQIKEALA